MAEDFIATTISPFQQTIQHGREDFAVHFATFAPVRFIHAPTKGVLAIFAVLWTYHVFLVWVNKDLDLNGILQIADASRIESDAVLANGHSRFSGIGKQFPARHLLSIIEKILCTLHNFSSTTDSAVVPWSSIILHLAFPKSYVPLPVTVFLIMARVISWYPVTLMADFWIFELPLPFTHYSFKNKRLLCIVWTSQVMNPIIRQISLCLVPLNCHRFYSSLRSCFRITCVIIDRAVFNN